MKNLLTAFLPALALFALGGCAGTAALSSSEDDGVYYSSKDRTTAVVSTAPAPASTDEAANPDYNGSTSGSSANQGSGSTQYYDNTYSYMKGVPSYGVTSYAPYSPYTSLSYGVSSYGWGGGACGFSPFAYGVYDPFYSPFYSPYGYGSGISISFGFGRPYGYGGYGGFGYGRPYGYGYGGGFYDPFYYSSPFYGGYYGRGGYYGSNYYGGGGYYGSGYGNSYYGNDNSGRGRTSGHRNDRTSDGRYPTGGVSGGGSTTGVPSGGGRVRPDGLLAPSGPTGQTGVVTSSESRSRTEGMTTAPSGTRVATPDRAANSYNQPRSLDRSERPQYRNMDQPVSTGRQPMDAALGQGEVIRDNNGDRTRNTETQPQMGQMQPQSTATPQPQQEGRRRGGFFQDVFSQPRSNGGQAADQPVRQRSYDQPQPQQQPQRSYDQPQRAQRTYEQPQQPQRSYEQPQQRSYEQPQRSYGGGGNSGGGGGGGGGHSRGRE